VAHNAMFDAGFLGMELYINSYRQKNRPTISNLDNPWFCTLQLARRNFRFGGNSLGHIARRLGVRAGVAHRAMKDVRVTAAVFERMVHSLSQQRSRTVADLFDAQGGPIYAPVPPEVSLPEPMANALAMGQRLRILYTSEHGESERIITPTYPSQHQGVTYLIAYCHLRNDQRTFRVDRILNAEPVADL
jgi:WYL domain/Exonuclease